MNRKASRQKKARTNLKTSHTSRAILISGEMLEQRRAGLLRLCVTSSELAVEGDTDGRWTLIITHAPGRFELEFMDTEGGGLMRGEGVTLTEAIEAAGGLRSADRTPRKAAAPRREAR